MQRRVRAWWANVLGRSVVLAVAVAVSAFVAIAVRDASAAPAGLTVAYSIPPTSLDPQQSNFNPTWLAWSLGYECLLRTTPQGDVQPLLATKYTVSDDRTVYTFTLRKGVRFHDGHTLNSQDVVFTFQRLLATGIPYARGLFPTLKSVDAVGPYAVRFTLSAPHAGFLLNMGNPYGVACAIVRPKSTGTQMDGTGPWQQSGYTPTQELDLKRFPHYWGKKPVAPTLKVLYMPEPATMLAALKSGSVDIAYPDPGIYPAIRGDKRFKIKFVGSARRYWLQINNEGALSDVRVRRAVLLSLNGGAIARGAFLGWGFEQGTIPSMYPWAPRVKDYKYAHHRDIAQAKDLLRQAGYPNGLKLRLAYPTGTDPVFDRGVQILKSQLADSGINADVEGYDLATWLTRHLAHNYDLDTNAHSWFADPLEYIRPRTGQYGGPIPPTVQALWDKAVASPDLKSYFKALHDLALEEDNQAFNLVGLAGQTVLVASKANLEHVDVDFTLTWLYLSNVSGA